MKAKKIVAVVMGAALAGTLAIGMSACSGGSKKPEGLKAGTLNIANYAVKYEDYMEDQGAKFEYEGYTKLESVYSYKQSDRAGSLSNGYIVVKDGKKGEDYLYAVVNPSTGKKILSGLASIPVGKNLPVYEGDSMYPSSSISAIQVDFVNADPAARDEAEIYTYDGTKILAKATYEEQTVRVTKSRLYVGNDAEASNVYKLEIVKVVNEKDEDVEVYVKENQDKKTYEKTYSVVNKSDLKKYAPDYAGGSDHSGLKEAVYEADEDYPVSGEIKDYEYSHIGNTYTFYKNGTETGNVDLTNGRFLAFMGNSLYYTVSIPVSPDATKGYNMAAIGSKIDCSLYKYDIVENTTTELKYDVIVTDMDVLYNYETKAYDAAMISGMKISDDGVAYGADEFTYVINNDFELCHDVTGKMSEAPEMIVDLGSNTYGIAFRYYSVVTDADLTIKSIISNENIPYANAGLVSFKTNNNYGFTDFNGKVVIAPEYSLVGYGYAPIFYGGVAHLCDADGEEVLFKKDGSVTKISDLEEETDTVVKTVSVENGIYTVTTVTTTIKDEVPEVKATVAYYAFNGTLLKSFDHANVQTVNNGIIMETVIKTDATTQETTRTYNYYKIA